jgi:hypothetical protein
MDIRERLKDLNTKAYYLLVALSFLYGRRMDTPTLSLKIAITLTALVAVLPVQDYVPDTWARLLKGIRFGKVVSLIAAFGFTLWWVWC